MSDIPLLSPEAFIEREKARLQKEATAKAVEAARAAAKLDEFTRKAQELYRLAAELNLNVVVPSDATLEASPEIEVSSPRDGSITTFEELINRYLNDDRSPYQKLQFSTRKYYDTCIKQLRELGYLRLADLTKNDIQNIYDRWTNKGTEKLSMGHALITMFRGLINFGFKTLDNPNCEKLALVLRHMHFAPARTRTEQLAGDQVDAIIKKAAEEGRPSIGFAQALQFECGLRQKEVIGEWVPLGETGISSTVFNGQKWMRGLRWEEIDHDLVLRHPLSSEGRVVEFSLKKSPRLMNELNRIGDLPKSGPMVVCEPTGRPWVTGEFRRWWRKIARGAGIPDHFRNADGRFSVERRNSAYSGRIRKNGT